MHKTGFTPQQFVCFLTLLCWVKAQVPVGAVICGQGTFHVRLAVLGANDEIKYSTVMDIELPQDALFGSMHVKVG